MTMRPEDRDANAASTGATLREVNRYWRRGGVPRRERQDRLNELRIHLVEAAGQGQRAVDVTGPDVAAFASEWIQADRSYPWADVILRFLAVLCLGTGGIVLLGPVGFGLDQFGARGESLVIVTVVALASLAVDIAHAVRHRIRVWVVGTLGLVGVVAAGLAGGVAIAYLDGTVYGVSWLFGALAILVGAACAALSWRLRRTPRSTNTA